VVQKNYLIKKCYSKATSVESANTPNEQSNITCSAITSHLIGRSLQFITWWNL